MKTLLLYPVLYFLSVHASTIVKNATYDDLQTLSQIPLGTYDNLVYHDVNVTGSRLSNSPGSGVVTVSPPNCAITPARGTTSFAVAAPYKSLGLLDFYFGCVTHSASGELPANGAAVGCTISVTGFLNLTYQPIVTVSYRFAPLQGLLQPSSMIHAMLPPPYQQPLFNFTITQSNVYAVVLIDNLRYSVST